MPDAARFADLIVDDLVAISATGEHRLGAGGIVNLGRGGRRFSNYIALCGRTAAKNWLRW